MIVLLAIAVLLADSVACYNRTACYDNDACSYSATYHDSAGGMILMLFSMTCQLNYTIP